MTTITNFRQPGADYKIVSSGTSHRSVSIVSGYKISAPIPIVPSSSKENVGHSAAAPHEPQHLDDILKRSSRYPVIPGLPLKPKLRRHGHVKKHSHETTPEDEDEMIAESPTQATPDRDSFLSLTPTQAKPRESPLTPAWAKPSKPVRYPSIFEDYYEDAGPALDSPIHTIEEIVAEKEHDTWGRYWDDKMDGHAPPEAQKPVLQRAATLEVADLLKSRRRHAQDFRQDSLASLREDDEL